MTFFEMHLFVPITPQISCKHDLTGFEQISFLLP